MSISCSLWLILLCFQHPGIAMRTGQLVFVQIMRQLPLVAFTRMVQRHRAQRGVKEFTCLDQFLALAFAQLTGRESLRDIEINLRAQPSISIAGTFVARRSCAAPDWYRPPAVFRRSTRQGTQILDGGRRSTRSIRPRSTFAVAVCLSTVSRHQGGDQAARCPRYRSTLGARVDRGGDLLRHG